MAVTQGKINGDIMGIYANGTLVAHAQDSSLSVSMDTIDTTEKDSNRWTEHIRGNRGWEISGNSLEVFASAMSVEQLIDFLINAESVSVQFKTTNVDDTVYSGAVSVTSTSFSAPQNAPAAFDFTFAGNGVLSKTGGFSSDAQAAFALYDSLGDGLTADEKTAMAIYIDAEVANSNHALKDFEAIFSLSGNNALVDYIGGTTLTNVNAPTQSLSGFAYNGSTQYSNLNFTPSTDGVNQALDDELFGIFVKANAETGNVPKYGIGAVNGAASAQSVFSHKPDSNQVGVASQHVSAVTSDSSQTGGFVANSLYVGERTANNSEKLYKDGSSIATSATASVALSDEDFYVGARNFAGASDHTSITVSSVVIGGAVGFNHSGYNTNLRTLLTSLGLTL